MIKAVIFDCFGVLYSQTRSDYFANVIPDFESQRQHLKDLGNQVDYGLISEDDFFNEIAEISGLSAEEVRSGMSTHTRNEKLVEYIKQLGTRVSIGVISNIGRGAFGRYFSETEQKNFFDNVVLSSEVGMVKPHPEIFELAAEQLGFDPSECVFIDDIEDNVTGAELVGMKGIHYQNVDLTIQQIDNLLEADNQK